MSWMKKQAKSVWTAHKIELFLGNIGLWGGIALILFSYPASPSPSDTIQSITLILLVIVTISYAKSTHKIHNVSLNAELNSVAPIVKLSLGSYGGGSVTASYINIGRGPALNLRVWLDGHSEQFEYLKSDIAKGRNYSTAVGVNEHGRCDWNGRDDGPERPLPDRTSGFNIVADYTDVFGRKFVSRSELSLHDEVFVYGLAKDNR